jgi:hypothetical protein
VDAVPGGSPLASRAGGRASDESGWSKWYPKWIKSHLERLDGACEMEGGEVHAAD